jgi:dihydroorotase
MRLALQNFRIVDESADFFGSVIIEDGLIKKIIPRTRFPELHKNPDDKNYPCVIDGNNFPGDPVLMPAFIDLHAHFRDSGISGNAFPSETLESGALAAAAGGYGTVICMANTKPVIDSTEKAFNIKQRSDVLGLIDLYPVLSLSKNMEGRELSVVAVKSGSKESYLPLMLSEDGRDIADDALFLAAMGQAKELGIPVSCHCDFGGPEAEAAKAAGRPRQEWSRIEEINAVRRVLDLGRRSGCHIHIAHISTAEAAELIREAKKSAAGFRLTCEAAPHHFGADEEDARRMGEESFGRVNPPLRPEADRRAILAALIDGTIDAIATDHAPHSEADKASGAPGFTGLETAFAVSFSNLTLLEGIGRLASGEGRRIAPDETGLLEASEGTFTSSTAGIFGKNAPEIPPGLCFISKLMSANPARILGLDNGRGRIAEGLAADLVIADIQALWKAEPEQFKSRGKCGPFSGKELRGRILMTFHKGRVVYGGDANVQ